MKNNSFNLIKRNDGALLILIFENKYLKDNVFFKINKDNKSLKLIYPENKNVIFDNIDNRILRCLSSKRNILVSEIDNRDNYSSGEITSSYLMKKKA
jgi:hypothetical protein